MAVSAALTASDEPTPVSDKYGVQLPLSIVTFYILYINFISPKMTAMERSEKNEREQTDRRIIIRKISYSV